MVEDDDEKPFFLRQNKGFGNIKPEDELLHPESFVSVSDPSATETQYFGFNVPEENIHGLLYTWWHPNLKVVSGGAMAFQGIKTMPLQAELMDWRVFMSDQCITKGDLHNYRLDNGYGAEVIEPFEHLRVSYEDTQNGNGFNLDVTAVQPAVMFDDGNHFEQAMKVKGDLLLRGKPYKVDCYNVRDRSWGKARPETLMPLGPMSWMTGVFSDDFAFNCTVFDHASGQPERNGEFVMPDDQALKGGWVQRDGKLGMIVKAHKRVARSPGGTTVSGIELQFTDEHGREFELRGSVHASCPIMSWLNIWVVINLIRWDYDGLVGYGDCQESFWNPYVNSRYVRGFS